MSTTSTITSPGELAQWLREAAEREQAVSLLQIDLDDFAIINTEAGREVGDRVIEAAWSVVRGAADPEGWSCARIGGDEFAVVAPALSLEHAFLRAETLRRELDEALAAALPDGLRCTASIGVANLPRDAKTGDELLRKADLALYSAKEQGGDALGLTPGDDMVLRSSYYTVAQLARLRSLAERLGKKEAVVLREALDDLLRKYDR
ncbi:MAG: diguanylate cyclase [Gaiellaceae bacterium]